MAIGFLKITWPITHIFFPNQIPDSFSQLSGNHSRCLKAHEKQLVLILRRGNWRNKVATYGRMLFFLQCLAAYFLNICTLSLSYFSWVNISELNEKGSGVLLVRAALTLICCFWTKLAHPRYSGRISKSKHSCYRSWFLLRLLQMLKEGLIRVYDITISKCKGLIGGSGPANLKTAEWLNSFLERERNERQKAPQYIQHTVEDERLRNIEESSFWWKLATVFHGNDHNLPCHTTVSPWHP